MMESQTPQLNDPRTKMVRILFFALVTMCVIGLGYSFGASRGDVIKVAFLGSKDDEDYAGAMAFKKTIETRTDGKISVQIFPAGQFCGNARECLEALQSGTLEVTMTTAGGAGSLFGAIQVLDLPYAFDDDDTAECVVDGPFAERLRRAFLDADTGLRLGVVSNTGGWRNFATVGTPVRRAEDLAGLKLRTVTAPIQQEMMRQLEASATPIAWSELYSALATRVVEGTKNSVQDIVGMKFHEHIKHLTLDGHAYMAAMWWYSADRWQALTPENKSIISDAFSDLQKATRQITKAGEASALAEFEAAGGTIYRPSTDDRQTFIDATSGMRDWFAERYGNDWLQGLDDAVDACQADLQS